MRIYANEATWSTLFDAARKAGVEFDRSDSFTPRVKRDEDGEPAPEGNFESGFDIILSGASRRHQNGGDNKAATWDQWGVFIAWVLHIDNDAKFGPRKRPFYDGLDDFNRKTNGRFAGSGVEPGTFPDDAHGDHTFRYDGAGIACAKCSARMVR